MVGAFKYTPKRFPGERLNNEHINFDEEGEHSARQKIGLIFVVC
jgi:hypothetical protein